MIEQCDDGGRKWASLDDSKLDGLHSLSMRPVIRKPGVQDLVRRCATDRHVGCKREGLVCCFLDGIADLLVLDGGNRRINLGVVERAESQPAAAGWVC
jgi:hypothetical protein